MRLHQQCYHCIRGGVRGVSHIGNNGREETRAERVAGAGWGRGGGRGGGGGVAKTTREECQTETGLIIAAMWSLPCVNPVLQTTQDTVAVLVAAALMVGLALLVVGLKVTHRQVSYSYIFLGITLALQSS